MNINLAN